MSTRPEVPMLSSDLDGHCMTASIEQLRMRFIDLTASLESAFTAMGGYADLAAYAREHYDRLLQITLAGMDLLQLISSAGDVTPDWLAQRDQFETEACTFLDLAWRTRPLREEIPSREPHKRKMPTVTHPDGEGSDTSASRLLRAEEKEEVAEHAEND